MKQKTYMYGMRLRGFSLGAQPMKGLIKVLDKDSKDNLDPEDRYHDLIAYKKELTDKEIEDYELDYICER